MNKLLIFFIFLFFMCSSLFAHKDRIITCKDGIKHPSELNIRNLPVFIGWCGTGRPSYVEKEEVYPIINDIFKEYGYKLKKDYKIKYANIECVLSGFDDKKQVGYIYGNWDSLDEDALKIWTHPRKGQELNIRAISHYLGKEYIQEVKKAESITDKKKQQKFLWNLVNKYRKKKSQVAISLEEIKLLPELYKRDKIFILFISQFDSRFTYSDHFTSLKKRLKKRIEKEKNLTKKKKIELELKRINLICPGTENTKSNAIKDIKINVKNALEWLKKESK